MLVSLRDLADPADKPVVRVSMYSIDAVERQYLLALETACLLQQRSVICPKIYRPRLDVLGEGRLGVETRGWVWRHDVGC